MYEKFGQFINGKWQQSSDKGTYEVINPANEEVLGHASKATSKDVDAALQSISKRIRGLEKNHSLERSYIIGRIADKMREKQDVLAKWMTLEVGKPLVEAKGEINGLQTFLSGMPKKQKEFMGRLWKVDSKILEFMFIINLLE